MNDLVLGRRGLGKTTLAVHIADGLNKHKIAWSPNAQFKMADFRTQNLEDLMDAIEDSEEDESFFAEYIPDGDLDANFTVFGSQLWRYGNFVLIVDESNELQTPQRINDILARYIRRAPRREKGDADPVDIIQTTHFPVDLHRVSFGLSDYAYIFRLSRERDFERIRVEFGEDVEQEVRLLRTPETTPPGRDVLKINIVTKEYEIITDSDTWNTKIAKPKENPLYVR